MSSKPDYHLIGLYTRYSSWTARVEAVLEYFQIPYTSEFITLDKAPTISPSARVPILTTSTPLNLTITDSLSIAEFLADQNPHLHLWPRDAKLRALARSAAAEMHSGFGTLRNTFHTNFVARYTGEIPVTADARKEIRRVLAIWDSSRRVTRERLLEIDHDDHDDVDEGFLFGRFSIADAFFWPVLWRFRTYNLPLDEASPEALKWMETMWNNPAMKRLVHGFYRQAERPETRIEQYENIFQGDGVQCEMFSEDWEFTAAALR
ncbi:hypothetical protein BDW59DRAFT_153587 [Aspergillus cavernicola]|uniref:GST N-terminal domain-containing protein n=1 Tax=Aspergillus cavernicola TaxID=176166 RepID=A0ABR4HK44_9EURO